MADDIRELYKWRKVEPPRSWRPTEDRQELCGFYGGKTIRNGLHGQYEVAIIHVPMTGTWTVTGVDVIQKIDAAVIPIGHPIRVVWTGTKELGNGHTMKTFEVMVAEGEALKAEDLPTLVH